MFTITRPSIALELAVTLIPLTASERLYADASGTLGGQPITFQCYHFTDETDARETLERWPDSDYLALLSPEAMEAIERRSFAELPEF